MRPLKVCEVHPRFSIWVSLLAATLFAITGGCTHSEPPNPKQDNQAKHPVAIGQISGHSMAPNFCASHLEIKCPDCQFEFKAQSAVRQSRQPVACPNCSNNFNLKSDASSVTELPAEEFVIESFDTLERWQVIAVQNAEKDLILKRLVGKPGETISFRDGDVFADNHRLVKPIAVQSQLWQPVFDSRFSGKKKRLQSGVHDVDLPIELATTTEASSDLKYTHFTNYFSNLPPKPEPIKDSYAYNQLLTRSLNNVSDIAIDLTFSKPEFSFDIEMESEKYGLVSLHVEATNAKLILSQINSVGPDPIQFDLDREKRDSNSGATTLRIAFVDGLLRIAENGHHRVEEELAMAQSKTAATATPIRLRQLCSKTGAKLLRFQIYRDLYYFEKIANNSYSLENNELFVLGDNVPQSHDSRHFGTHLILPDVIGVIRPEKKTDPKPRNKGPE